MSNTPTFDVDRMATMFKALANPTRLRIFLRMADCCSAGEVRCLTSDEIGAPVGEIGKGVDVGAPTVSHHLKELQNAGLISCRRRGQQVLCCIDTNTVDLLRAFLKGMSQDQTECS